MKHKRLIAAAGCILWTAGAAVFIIGLNLQGDAREWLTVAGSIAFLVGLGLNGVLYGRRSETRREQKNKTAAQFINTNRAAVFSPDYTEYPSGLFFWKR